MRIGVTTDFSGLASHAYGPSASLAQTFDADLSLIHQVHTSLPMGRITFEYDRHHTAIEAALKNITSTAPEFKELCVEPRLVGEESVNALSQEFANYDLIVTASHGRQGLNRAFLGSFAERIVRLSQCNVLVVRGDKERFEPRRILVAHDFTKSSLKPIEVACDWASRFSSEVKFLSVVDSEEKVTMGADAETEASWGQFYDLVRQNALHKLEVIAADKGWQELLTGIEIAEGNPAKQIVAESEHFDLVIVGRHAQRFLVGSTTEKVMRSAGCSVLVVGQSN